MARISFSKCSDYYRKLQELGKVAEDGAVIKKAVAAGAKPVADAIRENIEKLPEDKFRHLQEGEIFSGIAPNQKEDLLDSFGLSPIEVSRTGFVHTKAGFDEYGRFPTKSYPQGLPNGLLAAATESGSSVRKKTPFIAPAVKATRKEAIAAMEAVIDEEMKNIFEGG